MISVSYQFNIKQKIVILSIGLILAVVILIFFLLVPNIRGVKVLYADLDLRRQEAQDLIQLNSTPFLLERQLNELEAEMEDLYSSLLISGQEINFVQSLENFSRQYNVKQIINFNPTVSQNAKPLFPSADLSLILQGTFSDFLEYLIALDSSPYYINITAINVSSTGSRQSYHYSPIDLLPIQSDSELTAAESAESAPLVTALINAKIFWQYE
ncbi:MAG: hypothetical protein AAB525_04155 [Patescibacteria group bacterium]